MQGRRSQRPELVPTDPNIDRRNRRPNSMQRLKEDQLECTTDPNIGRRNRRANSMERLEEDQLEFTMSETNFIEEISCNGEEYASSYGTNIETI